MHVLKDIFDDNGLCIFDDLQATFLGSLSVSLVKVLPPVAFAGRAG